MNTKKNELIELMERYGDYLKRTTYIMTKDYQLAEDMTQETFLSYYKSMQFKKQASVKTYLYRILMNHIHMYYRKNKAVIMDQEDINFLSKEPIFFDDLLVKEIDLSNGLSCLKEKYRSVLILYYFDEFSVIEISKILNCGQSSVKMRLKRGRELLKKNLEKGASAYEKYAESL